VSDWWDKAYTATIDRYNPIKIVTDKMLEYVPKEIRDKILDTYKRIRLHAGVSGKIEAALYYKTFDYNDVGGKFQFTGKGLRPILDPVIKEGTLDDLGAFLIAKRTIELAEKGKASPVDIADAHAVVDKYGEKYNGVAQELYDFQDRMLKPLKDSGVIDNDMYEAIKKLNKNYISFARVFEDAGVSGTGKGMESYQPIKKQKGSETGNIVDPIEGMMKNVYILTEMAEKNNVMRSFTDLGKTSSIGGEFMTEIKTPLRPIEVQLSEMKAAMEKVPELKEMLDNGVFTNKELETYATIFRPSNAKLPDNVISVFENGIRKYYEVGTEVGRAFKGLDEESTPFVVKILAQPAKWLRAGSVYTPDFAMRNIVRDLTTAKILSKYPISMKDIVGGFTDSAKQTETLWQFMATGGAQSHMMSMDRETLQQNKHQLVGKQLWKGAFNSVNAYMAKEGLLKDMDAKQKAGLLKSIIKTPFDVAATLSKLSEETTKLAAFKAGLAAEGMTEVGMGKAAFEARDLLDFARHGSKIKVFNMITAFFNSNVQGVDKFGRGLSGLASKDVEVQKYAQGVLMKAIVGITVPSVLLSLINSDDEKYKALPQWQKDLFWIIPAGDTMIRIPKPFEIGLLFGTWPERILDSMKNNNPDAYKDIYKNTFNAFTPGAIPTVAVPFMESWGNKSLFTGRPIIGRGKEAELPQYRTQPFTTETAKELSKGLAKLGVFGDTNFISPAMIENTIGAWTGNLGRYAVKGIDAALRGAGAVPAGAPKPTWTLADWPVIQAFIARQPSSGSSNVENFYENWTKNSELKTTYDKLLKAGKPVEAQALLKSEGIPVKQQQVHSAMVNINAAIDKIYNSSAMSPDDKRKLVDNLYLQADAIARNANKQMAAYKKRQSRAFGGTVNAEQPYNVGELGTEMYRPFNTTPQIQPMLLGQGVFTPPASGVIFPHQMSADSGQLPTNRANVMKSIERRLKDATQQPQHPLGNDNTPNPILGVRG
jgi:hypothetical protein